MDILKPADFPDSFTRALYKVVPYQGCAHGCRYCDGRAERYYVEGDFEKDVVDRLACPSRLEADLPKVRERGIVAFGSGTTDPYQPREAELRLTGECARLLAEGPQPPGGRLPAMVMTKSALALRDLPYWARLAQGPGFVLMVSLTSLDEEVREAMEPGASSFAERLGMIQAFKAAGCAVGILAMPFLPGITDGEDNIRAVYGAAQELKVDFLMPGGLTLRPGKQKDFYLSALKAYRPDLLAYTRGLYAAERPSGWPGKEAELPLFERLARISQDYSLPGFLPHRVTAQILPAHDSFRILLRDMVELYAAKKVDTRPLLASAQAYDSWLVSLRRHFRRHRDLGPQWLEERFLEGVASPELEGVLDNPKLARFARQVCLDGLRLDYRSLELA